MARISIGPLSFGCTDAGSSPDVLLLIHGHPFNRSMWDPQVAAASAAGWRVVVPDLRGYGESTVVPGETPLSTFAADLSALLDRLGAGRVVVGGLSMGGQIAMEFCRQYPSRVRGLLLAATFPQPETPDGKIRRRAMADRLLREGMHGYATEVLDKMLAPASIAALPGVAAHVMAMMERSDPAGAAAALRGRAERPDYRPTLATFAGPSLVVVGSVDAFTTRADADAMHRLLSGSELLWLDGIGHMPNLEATDRFDQALLGLLGRVREVDEAIGPSSS